MGYLGKDNSSAALPVFSESADLYNPQQIQNDEDDGNDEQKHG